MDENIGGKTPGDEQIDDGGGSASAWTRVCVALADADIGELYRLVPLRTPIMIYP